MQMKKWLGSFVGYRAVPRNRTARGTLLPAAALRAKLQEQRCGDAGKESVFQSFTILESRLPTGSSHLDIPVNATLVPL